jgi:hypothetical protein
MSVSKLSLLFHNCKLISTLTTYLSGARLLVSNLVLTSLGTVKDYYVAYSLDNNTKTLGFPTKNFFWCSSSNYIFATLPLQMEKYSLEFSQMNFFLTGEHDRIVLENAVTEAIVIDEDAGLIIPAK